MIVIHYTNVESQLPLPNQQQMMIILLNGFFCSLFADYLWLYSTMLTNSLLSSLSITLSIPLAMIADTVFRDQSPNVMQVKQKNATGNSAMVFGLLKKSYVNYKPINGKNFKLKLAPKYSYKYLQ